MTRTTFLDPEEDPNNMTDVNITLDWQNLLDDIPEDSGQRDLIPPDTYLCTVEKAEANLAKSGNSKIDLTLTVADGPHRNRPVWGRINFATSSPKSMAITIDQLAEFGVTRAWLGANNPSVAQIASKLVGKPINVKVEHREYEGKQYYDIKKYSRPISGEGVATSGVGTGSDLPF